MCGAAPVRSVPFGWSNMTEPLTLGSWRSMISDGLEMRHGKELTWSQVVMAANTPMLLRAGLVEGNTDAGVLASGQVAGILDDLPSCAELIDTIVSDAITYLQTAAQLITVGSKQ